MIGYKAFNPGWKCMDFQYEIGKTYELEEGRTLEICKCGFHFCKNPIDVFGYYPMNDDVLIAEVEALGKIEQEGTKCVTDKIRIVKELTRKELQTLILDGKYNTGGNNTGTYNSGSDNSGYYNSGNYNSGYYNSGNYNSGYYNSGSRNSGSYNSGNYNSGYYNSRDCNSGDYNSGSYNSGSYNSGSRNSGYYNSGDCNSGFFNSDEPKMRMFNRETKMTFTDFYKSIDYSFCKLCYRIYKNALIEGDVDKIKALPNFDSAIFEHITGIKIEEVSK